MNTLKNRTYAGLPRGSQVFMSYGTYPVILALAISNIVMIVKQKKKKG